MQPVTYTEDPVIVETTGEEVPASARPRRTENPTYRAPEPRPDIVPFASTLRRLAPSAPFLPEPV